MSLRINPPPIRTEPMNWNGHRPVRTAASPTCACGWTVVAPFDQHPSDVWAADHLCRLFVDGRL